MRGKILTAAALLFAIGSTQPNRSPGYPASGQATHSLPAIRAIRTWSEHRKLIDRELDRGHQAELMPVYLRAMAKPNPLIAAGLSRIYRRWFYLFQTRMAKNAPPSEADVALRKYFPTAEAMKSAPTIVERYYFTKLQPPPPLPLDPSSTILVRVRDSRGVRMERVPYFDGTAATKRRYAFLANLVAIGQRVAPNDPEIRYMALLDAPRGKRRYYGIAKLVSARPELFGVAGLYWSMKSAQQAGLSQEAGKWKAKIAKWLRSEPDGVSKELARRLYNLDKLR